jgi:transcriptional regulator with XRE-family HTH domain
MTDELRIGARLKATRREKGLTLQQVADVAGLSKSFVSQVETGVVQPSIGSLKKIGDVLSIPLAALFEPGESPVNGGAHQDNGLVRVVKANRRKKLQWPNGARAELLTPNLQGKLEVMLTTYDAQSTTQLESYTHEGEEFGFVIEGTFEVVVNGQSHILEEGDSICFQSHLPHSTRAVGDKPVRTFWVITPPSF